MRYDFGRAVFTAARTSWTRRRGARAALLLAAAVSASTASLLLAGAADVTVAAASSREAARVLPPAKPEDNIVAIERRPAGCGDCPDAGITFERYRLWAANAKSFAGMGIYRKERALLLPPNGMSHRADGAAVSAGLFQIFNVKPRYGRLFAPADGGNNVVILSQKLFQRITSGGDPAILNRYLQMNDRPFVIAGVMPASFQFPKNAEFWISTPPQPPVRDEQLPYSIVARLADGVTAEQAAVELQEIERAIDEDTPQTAASQRYTVTIAPYDEVKVR